MLDPRPLREKMGANRKWKPSAKCLVPITNGNPLILILEVDRREWDENPRISQVNVQFFFQIILFKLSFALLEKFTLKCEFV